MDGGLAVASAREPAGWARGPTGVHVRSNRFLLNLLALVLPSVAQAGNPIVPWDASQLDEGIFAVKQPGNTVPTAYVSSHIVAGVNGTPPAAHEHWWIRVGGAAPTWSATAASWEFAYLGTPMAEGRRPDLIPDASVGEWREYLVTYHTTATGSSSCAAGDAHPHRKCGLYTVTQPPSTAVSHHLGFNLSGVRHQHWYLDTATWQKPSRTNCLVVFSFGTAATIPASAEGWVPGSGGPYQSMKTTLTDAAMSPTAVTNQSGC